MSVNLRYSIGVLGFLEITLIHILLSLVDIQYACKEYLLVLIVKNVVQFSLLSCFIYSIHKCHSLNVYLIQNGLFCRHF